MMEHHAPSTTSNALSSETKHKLREVMANPEHLEILRRSVAEWNEWRINNPDIKPDLSHEDLPRELVGAEFSRCNLAGSRLGHHDLTYANLFDADLSGADLTGSKLSGADLTQAKLLGTKLMDADLIGCNLSMAKPWLAQLFWDIPALDTSLIPEDVQGASSVIKSVGELLKYSRAVSNHYRNLGQQVSLYFRGESKAEWDLTPSIMRDELLSEHEGQLLVDLASKRPEDFNELRSALAQWVLAQHHRLPTRFLDITRDALVALFNACRENGTETGKLYLFVVPEELIKSFTSDTLSVISNFARLTPDDQKLILGDEGFNNDRYIWFEPNRYSEAMGRLYQLVQQEKPYFAERVDPRSLFQVFVAEPQQTNERIRAQSGAFLVSAFHRRFEIEKILEKKPPIPLYDYHILMVPWDYKGTLMEELELANKTEESLLPGLSSSAASVVKYRGERRAYRPPNYI